jgi:hypothetical protein
MIEGSSGGQGVSDPSASRPEEGGQTFDLTRLDEAGYDKLYRAHIEQPLLAREAERQAGVKTYWRRLIPGSIAVVVLAVILAAAGAVQWALIGAFVGLVGAATFAHWPLSSLSDEVKHKTLTTIAQTIGCRYQTAGFDASEIPRMLDLGLLPPFDRASYEDCIEGRHLKCGFELFEGHLERKYQSKRGTHWATCFRGQIIRVVFPKKFAGVTVVRRDLGWFNFVNRFGSGELKRVGLADPKFEREFEVYATDQVEGRELVHPVFMERLLALETKFDGKRIRCAFQAGDLLVAVEGRNRFELGSMFKPLADPARIRGMVNDVAEIMRLIDSILTAEKAPLLALGNKDLPADA